MKHKQLITKLLLHGIIISGIVVLLFPLYVALVASTHSAAELLQAPIPLLPGHLFLENYKTVLLHGMSATGGQPINVLLLNSFMMALLIAIGKVTLALLSAYALVYFHFPLRQVSFWLILITLLLPVEVRILPTFTIVAQLHLLNSFAGLSLPLIASATATLLFRQFFLTIPNELLEAARMDGAGPLRFFWDVVLPLSRGNIAALFIIMFIYGWNQYLWPLVITTEGKMDTIVMGIQRLANVADQIPQWQYICVMAVMALLPPVIIVLIAQRWLEKGLSL